MKGIIKKEYENNMKKESKKWEKEKQKEETKKEKCIESGSSTFASLGGLPVLDCSLDLRGGQLRLPTTPHPQPPPSNLALLLHVLMCSNTWLPELGGFLLCEYSLSFYRFHSHRV